jgi:hypothetical protein
MKWPPPEEVLAFWESGFGGHTVDDEFVTVVALIRADVDVEEVKLLVEKTWNPGVREWRFADLIKDPEKPPNDRFGAPDWSVELGRWPWKT